VELTEGGDWRERERGRGLRVCGSESVGGYACEVGLHACVYALVFDVCALHVSCI
jgi:hypothetical protein